MKFSLAAALAACILVAAPLTAAADPLTYPGLKTLVGGMGYEAKEIGTADSPKFEAAVKTASFNVPLGFEITKSNRYIWVTASLGQSKLDGAAALNVLTRMTNIQPTSLWISGKGILMIGIAVDNRDVTPAHMKFVIDKLAEDVGATADLWQTAAGASTTASTTSTAGAPATAKPTTTSKPPG